MRLLLVLKLKNQNNSHIGSCLCVHFVSYSVNQDGSQEPRILDMELKKYFSALDTQLCFPKKNHHLSLLCFKSYFFVRETSNIQTRVNGSSSFFELKHCATFETKHWNLQVTIFTAILFLLHQLQRPAGIWGPY